MSLFNPSLARAQVALQGAVTDRETGLPVANARVFHADIYGNSPATTTDADGTWSLTADQIRNAASGTLSFQATGYFVALLAYAMASSPTTMNATLLPGGTVIEGIITDTNTQAGIVGAAVNFYADCNAGIYKDCSADFALSATSGTGGRYSIDSSLILESGAAGLRLIIDQVTAAAYVGVASNVSVPAAAPLPITRNYSLAPSSGVALQGTVSDRPTGL